MGKVVKKEHSLSELILVVNETENLTDVLLRHKVDIQNIRKEINLIASKVHNNKIGYARFHTKSHNIKLIICPKIFGYDQDKFLSYLNSFYQMLRKYPGKIKHFGVDNTFLEIALNAERSSALGFDDLLENKYLTALQGVYRFFRRFKTFRPRQIDHVSHNVEYEINLVKTIQELDKSKIHQYREVSDYHTFFAEIALSTLKQFRVSSKHNLSEHVMKHAQKSFRLISSKFKLRSNLNDYKKLFDRKYIKYFKNSEEKTLYSDLLTLLGKENFFNKGLNISEKIISEKVTSIFFEANILYELHVYDFLINKYGIDKIEVKPEIHYSIKDKHSATVKALKAEPDFVVDAEQSRIVIDAKWKLLSTLDSSFVYDYLKLQRDADLFETLHCELVYPVISLKETLDLPLYIDTRLSSTFNLELQEVPAI